MFSLLLAADVGCALCRNAANDNDNDNDNAFVEPHVERLNAAVNNNSNNSANSVSSKSVTSATTATATTTKSSIALDRSRLAHAVAQAMLARRVFD